MARTGGDKHKGLAMFHMPASTPGIEIRGIETMGGKEVNDVFFTGVRLPADAVVGEVDGGWGHLMAGHVAGVGSGVTRRAQRPSTSTGTTALRCGTSPGGWE